MLQTDSDKNGRYFRPIGITRISSDLSMIFERKEPKPSGSTTAR